MKKSVYLAAGALLVAAMAAGCAPAPAVSESPSAAPDAAQPAQARVQTLSADAGDAAQEVSRALVLANLGEQLLLANEETGSVYFAAIPDELTGADGAQIGAEELVPGNVIEMRGNGVMARSFPGKYMGVSAISVLEEGDAADVAPYQESIDRFAPGAAEGEQPGEHVNRAMYVPFGKDSHIMVDQDTGAVFVVSMPDEICGLDGERIAAEDLQAGNIVEIHGNGIMALSYPGQYHGVTRIQVVEQGAPEDAEQYQSIVDELYAEPDPAEPPQMQAEYRIPEAIVYASTTRGNFTWSYPDEQGETQTVTACGATILQNAELHRLRVTQPTTISLSFSGHLPTGVTVTRWPAELMGSQQPDPEGEAVACAPGEEDAYVIDAEAGYVYYVSATFEQGSVDYGFVTGKDA